jgi:pimeloyl-ACP methyl ester carboxylesterase
MARATGASRQVDAQPRVRRGYFECRYGQLHVHNAIPPGGGFEEGTPLLCLHRSPLTGAVFGRFMLVAGRDRSVYAPDIPGFGDSDAPTGRPGIAEFAAAIEDFLDTMRFRHIDVVGYTLGALIAAELAIARPAQIRRVVLASVPVLSESEREGLRRASASAAPAAVPDGAQLAGEWRRTVESYGAHATAEPLMRAFADRLRNSGPASAAAGAALQYPIRERLSLITQQVLVLRPRDELWDSTPRVRELLPRARFVDLPEQGAGLFELAPAVVADTLREFLRG